MKNHDYSQKIIYVGEGKRIPFSEWLKQKKEETGLSWAELSEDIGVKSIRTYSSKHTYGQSANPGWGHFGIILDYFNASPKDFEILRGLKKDFVLKPEKLRELGELALKHGFKIIRSGLIKKVFGNGARGILNSLDAKAALVELLRGVEPSRYSQLKYVAQKQQRGETTALSDEEKLIIEREFRIADGQRNDCGRLFGGFYEALQKELRLAGYGRSIASLKYHCKKMLCGETEKQYKLLRVNSPVEREDEDENQR